MWREAGVQLLQRASGVHLLELAVGLQSSAYHRQSQTDLNQFQPRVQCPWQLQTQNKTDVKTTLATNSTA